MVRRAFGVTSKLGDDGWYDEWDGVAESLGALDPDYVYNDQIASFSVDGPHGWVSWGGQVHCPGMALLGKWPKIGEVNDDWRRIAHAFPFLELTAQLVAEDWDDAYDRFEGYRPLAAWTIANGLAELKDDPGEPLFAPPDGTRDEQLARAYERGLPKEQGVSEKRLRVAVERCRKKALQGQ
jgi:hypothetical protein